MTLQHAEELLRVADRRKSIVLALLREVKTSGSNHSVMLNDIVTNLSSFATSATPKV